MKRRQGKSRYLDKSEIRRVIDFQNGNKLHGARNVCILTTLSLTGCRVSELCFLDIGDVANEDGSIRDRWVLRKENTKSKKSHTLFINSILKKSVNAYLTQRKERGEKLKQSTPLFVSQVNGRFTPKSLQITVKIMCKKVGLDEMVSTHSFRRTMITNLFRSGVDVKTVSTLVNHSNIYITDSYIQQDEVKLKNVVNSMKL
jgi:site-specific recombinase XerD